MNQEHNDDKLVAEALGLLEENLRGLAKYEMLMSEGKVTEAQEIMAGNRKSTEELHRIAEKLKA